MLKLFDRMSHATRTMVVRGKRLLSCETLAQRLRAVRKEKGLKARQLSLMAGLSPSVVQMIEDEHRMPGIDTVEKLALALQTSKAWLGFGEGPRHRQEVSFAIAPGFDPMKMSSELAALLNGPGGQIEQSYKYLDTVDAVQWCALLQQTRYSLLMEQRPLAEIASVTEQFLGRGGCDLIALGAGAGTQETRLVTSLLETGYQDLRLFLLDVSQPLLAVACKQATEVLTGEHSIPITAVLGNFFQLPSYESLFQTSHRRRRLLCMLGYTFGNLDNEVSFVRNCLTGAEVGDLLLLDAGVAKASADDAAQIRASEPVFAKKRSSELMRQLQQQEAFNIGPLLRYRHDIAEYEYSYLPDTASCVVPGSYAIRMRASVTLHNGEKRLFSLGMIKRYSPQPLLAQMEQDGWKSERVWYYGDGGNMICLFRRVGDVTSRAVAARKRESESSPRRSPRKGILPSR